jgi:hypothetical protein
MEGRLAKGNQAPSVLPERCVAAGGVPTVGAARGQSQATHMGLPAVELHVSRCRDQGVGPAMWVEEVAAAQIVRKELATIAVANHAAMLRDAHVTGDCSAATAKLDLRAGHLPVEHRGRLRAGEKAPSRAPA